MDQVEDKQPSQNLVQSLNHIVNGLLRKRDCKKELKSATKLQSTTDKIHFGSKNNSEVQEASSPNDSSTTNQLSILRRPVAADPKDQNKLLNYNSCNFMSRSPTLELSKQKRDLLTSMAGSGILVPKVIRPCQNLKPKPSSNPEQAKSQETSPFQYSNQLVVQAIKTSLQDGSYFNQQESVIGGITSLGQPLMQFNSSVYQNSNHKISNISRMSTDSAKDKRSKETEDSNHQSPAQLTVQSCQSPQCMDEHKALKQEVFELRGQL